MRRNFCDDVFANVLLIFVVIVMSQSARVDMANLPQGPIKSVLTFLPRDAMHTVLC